MPTPIKKATPKPLTRQAGPAPEEEQYQAPASGSSKADLFNKSTPASGFSVPVGNYVANLVEASHEKEDGTEKESVKFTYEVAEGEKMGETIPAWYSLFDKDGKPMRGAEFLKRDMELLGGPDLDYDQLQDQLNEVVAERPLCNIVVKLNKGYTNVFFQGLAEG